jgi:hypothetical protein
MFAILPISYLSKSTSSKFSVPYDMPCQYQFLVNLMAAIICAVQAKSYQVEAPSNCNADPPFFAIPPRLTTTDHHLNGPQSCTHHSLPICSISFFLSGDLIDRYRNLTVSHSSTRPPCRWITWDNCLQFFWRSLEGVGLIMRCLEVEAPAPMCKTAHTYPLAFKHASAVLWYGCVKQSTHLPLCYLLVGKEEYLSPDPMHSRVDFA